MLIRCNIKNDNFIEKQHITKWDVCSSEQLYPKVQYLKIKKKYLHKTTRMYRNVYQLKMCILQSKSVDSSLIYPPPLKFYTIICRIPKRDFFH